MSTCSGLDEAESPKVLRTTEVQMYVCIYIHTYKGARVVSYLRFSFEHNVSHQKRNVLFIDDYYDSNG